jgi:LPS-assembly lipoprotein
MQSIFKNIFRIIILCVVLCLAGCGFALKSASKPLPFQSLQVQASNNSVLTPAIITALLARGITIQTDAKSAVPRLVLYGERRDKVVRSTSTTGRVREYTLTQQVTVQLFSSQGQNWLEPITLTQSRDFSYNDSQVLAKEIEEQALYQQMQQALVLALMVRLEATSNTPKPLPLADIIK